VAFSTTAQATSLSAAPVVLRVVADPVERDVAGDRVAGHENPFRLFDHRSPPERSLLL